MLQKRNMLMSLHSCNLCCLSWRKNTCPSGRVARLESRVPRHRLIPGLEIWWTLASFWNCSGLTVLILPFCPSSWGCCPVSVPTLYLRGKICFLVSCVHRGRGMWLHCIIYMTSLLRCLIWLTLKYWILHESELINSQSRRMKSWTKIGR